MTDYSCMVCGGDCSDDLGRIIAAGGESFSFIFVYYVCDVCYDEVIFSYFATGFREYEIRIRNELIHDLRESVLSRRDSDGR